MIQGNEITAIPADVRERVVAAADSLYAQAGRATMPTVDAVRREARVDMNSAVAVMRQWRRAQTAQAAPVAVAVPDGVRQVVEAAAATIWQSAQAQANDALRAAQGAWEAERADESALRQELAEAFELASAELNEAQARINALLAAEAARLEEIAAARQELASAQERAAVAEARAAELRIELDRAHQQLVGQLGDVLAGLQERAREGQRLDALPARRGRPPKSTA